jgi:HSP20 family molecular chaperone IbpA
MASDAGRVDAASRDRRPPSHFLGDHEGWVGQRVEGHFAPAFDIIVKDGAVVMKADLPGIDPKFVDVTVHRDRLTINGERKAEREEHETGAGVPRGSLRVLLVHHAAAGPH